ncbi:hypothetical protein T07_4223 [Trichinella nelsoni]|uniref:Uncharacterized protein n=1 Tax=Trichinella nelsoni TaxID=6336 RepID=A0A0V0SMP8_9BILA|nr:hypothetical protein T07_4223 [Trichinella nelsoni]
MQNTWIGLTSDSKKSLQGSITRLRLWISFKPRLQVCLRLRLQAMPGATPPAILSQITKFINFSNNLPQATPPASPQAIFKKTFALGARLRQFLKNYLPRGYTGGYASGNFEICI